MSEVAVTVELFYSGGWHTANDVYTRDPITITRGRPDQVQRIPPSTLNLTFDNRQGTYSPRNPAGVLYRLIGRNTPIRVSVGSDIRFVGEVESWPQRWNVKGNDAWAPITANGILRRLNAPGTTKPAWSALRRTITLSSPTPIAYWPLEEDSESAELGSGLLGGQPMVFGTTPPLLGNTNLAPGAVAGVDVGNEGAATGLVVGGSNGSWSVSWVGYYLRKDSDPVIIISVLAGQIRASVILLATTVSTSFFGPANDVTVDGAIVAHQNPGNVRPHHCTITATQAGADITVTMRVDGVQTDSDTITGATCTPPTKITINGDPVLSSDSLADGTVLLTGHLAVFDAVYTTDLSAEITARTGDLVSTRMALLAGPEDITLTFYDAGATETMGVQRAEPLLDLLYDAADADGGILYENREDLALIYRRHATLYNQTPVLALDYSAGDEVAPPLEPVEDTDATGNDITVTRYQGGFANVVQETGTLNVQEPVDDPDGAGRYRRDFTYVLEDNSQCLQRAAWTRHLGTWDEARYPVVTLDLTAMDAAGKTALIADAVALDIGDRFTISNPPAWISHDSIELLAQGFTETIESHHWTIAVNATPALPYDVLQLETDVTTNLSRIPASLTGTVVNETFSIGETTLDIVSTTARWIDSATYPAQFPFYIVVQGERMSCTAITGTGLTQTMTVVRSIAKADTFGDPVQLFRPPVIAR